MAGGLDPYPDPDARDRALAAHAGALGAELVRYGSSVAGRPLLALRAPQRGRDAAPAARVVCAGNIHGLEYVSAMVVLGIADALEHHEPLRRLRERAELWLVPSLNPDGYARTWEAEGRGRVRDLRPNDRGVDLNRNFPLPGNARRLPLPGAGSARPGAATYRGPAPLSEPESAALADLLARLRPRAATSSHSFMGRLITPRVTGAGDDRAYGELCRAFGAAQPTQRYRRLACRWLDTFTGELEDHQHHTLGCWAVCVETFPIGASLRQHLRAPSAFWRFNPREPRPWVENDVPGIAAFLHAALDRPR